MKDKARLQVSEPFCQRHHLIFLIIEVIDQEFNFESKDKARRYFQELVQAFKTWNSLEFGEGEFQSKEKEMRDKIQERKAQESE